MTRSNPVATSTMASSAAAMTATTASASLPMVCSIGVEGSPVTCRSPSRPPATMTRYSPTPASSIECGERSTVSFASWARATAGTSSAVSWLPTIAASVTAPL
jgi:Tfp pilus assembly protein PilV